MLVGGRVWKWPDLDRGWIRTDSAWRGGSLGVDGGSGRKVFIPPGGFGLMRSQWWEGWGGKGMRWDIRVEGALYMILAIEGFALKRRSWSGQSQSNEIGESDVAAAHPML